MTPQDVAATLAHWRAQGADRHDPVGFHVIEAMLRRSANQHGATRQWLAQRIARRVRAYHEALDRASSPASGPAPVPASAPAAAPLTGALAGLAARLGQAAGLAPATARPAGDAAGPPPAAPARSRQALDDMRRTWARLDAERRLAQALAQAPANAGPLNSQQLVLRSLLRMREISPAYLERFVTHVDALMWLERGERG